MRYGAGLAATILIWFALVLPAGAQGENYPPIPNADELIKHCWDISLELRSQTGTGAMEAGGERTARCFEDAVKENMRILLKYDNMNSEGKTLDDLMKDIHTSMFLFYDNLYSNNIACGFTCGNIWGIISRGDLAHFYEMMLKTVLSHRELREERFHREPAP